MRPSITPLLLLVLPALTTAVEIRFFANTGCQGAYTSQNPANNAQCYVPGGNYRSVQFVSVPSGAKGQAYLSYSCSVYSGEVGSGTNCLSFNSGFVHAANWFYPF